tara:strand:- start:186 stop:1118 length:933 start_codon:yes stop_codon:yes gene_type:complete
MPLIPKLKACVADKCTKLILTDATGLYASTNVGGWGAPNINPPVAGFTVSVTVDAGTPIDMLDNMGFPTSTVVTTPETLPVASDAFVDYTVMTLMIDLPAVGTVISDPLQILITDSVNDRVFKLNTAFDSLGSGFFAYNLSGSVKIRPPVGSGDTYNSIYIYRNGVPGTPLYAFNSAGVDAVPEVTGIADGPVTGVFTYNDIAADLTDGWHTIVYTITATVGSITETYTDTIKIFTYCDIKCCVFSKMLEMKTLDLCKDVEKVASYMHLWTLYKSLIYAANGCDASQATDILLRLNKLCPAATTGGCGCS